MTSQSAPVFLLGVGAQKAGTSWLSHYLRQHPETAMGKIKELQFFNSHFADPDRPGMIEHNMKRAISAIQNRRKEVKYGKDFQYDSRMIGNLESVLMHYEPSRYPQYFEDIWKRNPTMRLTGDITPDYAAMSREGTAKMARFVGKLPFRVKVVFVMRDPVERAYSAFRMRNRKRRIGGLRVPLRGSFLTFCQSKAARARSGYHETIENLEAAFETDSIHYAFYEELFTDPEIQRLCDFLEISYVEAPFETKRNAGGEKTRPSDKTIIAARDLFSETYEFCQDRFGQDRINRLWQPRLAK